MRESCGTRGWEDLVPTPSQQKPHYSAVKWGCGGRVTRVRDTHANQSEYNQDQARHPKIKQGGATWHLSRR
nr:MAG TPA: hypothetical protein [Caudoviricetes sp.]